MYLVYQNQIVINCLIYPDINMNVYLKVILSMIAGALLGYAYYYFIGCNSGTCPITSNWHISTLYGAGMGLIASFPTKKKKAQKDEDNRK